MDAEPVPTDGTSETLPPLTEIAEEEVPSNPDDVVNSLNAPIKRQSIASELSYRLSVELPETILEAIEEKHLPLPETEEPQPENQENEPQDEQPQPEMSSQELEPENSVPICKDRGCLDKITFGETEKEQLKSVGINLLRIGQQLLEEMNFMENLVASFDGNVDRCSRHGSIEDTQLLRKEIESNVDKLASHAQRLSWLQQKSEEFKKTTKAAQFGSAFGTPDDSTSATLMMGDALAGVQVQGKRASQQSEPGLSSRAENTDFEKRLALVETKVEGLTAKVENCEKQTVNAYNQIQGLINRIFEDIADMRNTILQNNSQAQSVCTGVNDKIQVVEQQIVQLAQTLWELQCMTKVQMHFGKETG
ncbi:hypothetical protein Ocin01_13640 [Orchesella cincta]|uniref:Uncharacterized protein n=1 Tax=Orchesella cincta TaxID=48709 RepID=A0A1D2MJ46_ORCCI|nr:hypothetical protein Ocin01_13640 [Orchesella cincta]